MLSKRTLCALGSCYAAEGCFLHLLAEHSDFLRSGEASRFVLFGVGAGLMFWVAAGCFLRATFSTRGEAWTFWIGAVLLRLVVLPVVPGDDLWRYRWEGMIQLHGFNPYALGPEAAPLAFLRDADWSKINHRDYPAIYPPLTQAFFAALAFFGNSAWLYKAVFSLADLACCGVLRRLLRDAGIGGASAVWYAWNPLVVYAFTGAAHFDCLMILALLGAIWALDTYRRTLGQSTPLLWLSALLLGVAAAIKIVPLALFPVWMAAAASWRRVPGMFALTLAPLAVTAAAYGFPRTPVFAALGRFGRDFRVNDPVWTVLDAATGSRLPGSHGLVESFTLFACLLLAFLFRRDWRRGLLWVWGALLLLSPVVHAWYAVWVLPVAVWRGRAARPWVILSISIFGYFLLWEVNHASGRPWVEPLWLRLSIYAPPALALFWTILAPCRVQMERTGSTVRCPTDGACGGPRPLDPHRPPPDDPFPRNP